MPVAAFESQPVLRVPGGEPVERVETHISWVFLTADRAYKVKKPAVLPFLDYGTAERRRALCYEEVRLNRRLAPELYLGVRGLARGHDAWVLVEAGDARAEEWAVEMRRFDESRTLESRVRAGTATSDDVVAVGRVLARFHETARVVAAGDRRVAAARRVTEDNFRELAACGEAVRPQRLRVGRRFVDAFLACRGGLLEQRGSAGLVREGHGDLRAEHVLLGDRVEVFDCIEFARHLREIDVSADLAFLVMDLVHRGREDFADTLVDSYREAGGDPGEDVLLSFFAAYRAWVRAKVGCLRAAELAAEDPRRAVALDEAGARAATARLFEWRARAPFLLVLCGGAGTGKTYLAKRLAAVSGWRHLNSDTVRKELLGLTPTERAPEAAYTAGVSRRIYAQLADRAAAELAKGRGVIVDATFRFARDRRSFVVASRAPRLFVECRAPTGVLVQRARQRAEDPTRSSDADLEQVERQQREFEPLRELPREGRAAVRTTGPLEDLVDEIEALLDRRLAG